MDKRRRSNLHSIRIHMIARNTSFIIAVSFQILFNEHVKDI